MYIDFFELLYIDLYEDLKEYGPIDQDDASAANILMSELQGFQQNFDEQHTKVKICEERGEVIFKSCHPAAVLQVKHQMAVLSKRWKEFSCWAISRKQYLDTCALNVIETEKEAQVPDNSFKKLFSASK